MYGGGLTGASHDDATLLWVAYTLYSIWDRFT
jgi:hypothetical protein